MNLLNFLFPRRCVSCGKIGRYFCQCCIPKMEFIGNPICPVCEKPAIEGMTHPRCKTRYTLDGLMSFFRYKGPVRQAIKLLKYKFVSDLTEEFISLIPFSSLHSTMKQYSNVAILIPIPLHPSRLRFRGFNQAEVLGKLLAERLNIPMKTDILKRIRKTTPQVEVKDRKKRLKNMENAFSVNNLAMKQCSNLPAGKAGVTILLFDDVFTTGGTLRAAANVLKRAGVKRVWGLVLAHG